MRFTTAVSTLFVLALGSMPAGADKSDARIRCEMEFRLQGWSAFYKTAKGSGKITCDDGKTLAVRIKSKGGGLTFGKSEIVDGHGKFSPVGDVSQLLGSYVQAEAHAGAVKSSKAAAMTKGEVSLALSGTGSGIDLGVAFGKFTISAE